MKLIVKDRYPGDHRTVWEGEWPTAPRVDEIIYIEDVIQGPVHKVTHDIEAGAIVVLVRV